MHSRIYKPVDHEAALYEPAALMPDDANEARRQAEWAWIECEMALLDWWG